MHTPLNFTHEGVSSIFCFHFMALNVFVCMDCTNSIMISLNNGITWYVSPPTITDLYFLSRSVSSYICVYTISCILGRLDVLNLIHQHLLPLWTEHQHAGQTFNHFPHSSLKMSLCVLTCARPLPPNYDRRT
jgi:hypothetical protein